MNWGDINQLVSGVVADLQKNSMLSGGLPEDLLAESCAIERLRVEFNFALSVCVEHFLAIPGQISDMSAKFCQPDGHSVYLDSLLTCKSIVHDAERNVIYLLDVASRYGEIYQNAPDSRWDEISTQVKVLVEQMYEIIKIVSSVVIVIIEEYKQYKASGR